MLAPIILFVYNRPWHTERMLNALKANDLADQSILYIFADEAKKNASKGTVARINEIRQLLRRENWCKEVHIVERSKNWGLANSIEKEVYRFESTYTQPYILDCGANEHWS